MHSTGVTAHFCMGSASDFHLELTISKFTCLKVMKERNWVYSHFSSKLSMSHLDTLS